MIDRSQVVTREPISEAISLESISATTTFHRTTVDRVGVFYREAGPKYAPTIGLLHGFPSSWREFDLLIPLLAFKRGDSRQGPFCTDQNHRRGAWG